MGNLGATKMSMTTALVLVLSVLLLSCGAHAAARRLGTVDGFRADFGAQLKKATSNPNYYVGMKRLVPTGPNPQQSGTPPPSPSQLKKATSLEGSSIPTYYVGMKRLVPTGPNPQQSATPPPSPPSL